MDEKLLNGSLPSCTVHSQEPGNKIQDRARNYKDQERRSISSEPERFLENLWPSRTEQRHTETIKIMMHRALSVLVVAMFVTDVSGHGAMTFPKPRNAIDGHLAPWSQWSYPCDDNHQGSNCSITFCENGKNCQGSCPISAHNGVIDALNASNGQSCYWFSNGCMIGCSECDGTNNHYGHGAQQFLYKGMSLAELKKNNITMSNPWNPTPGDMVMDPKSIKALNISVNCASPTQKATICDPRLRTMNTQVCA